MDKEKLNRAKSIDFQMGHIRRDIPRLEKGWSVFHICEEFQNVLDNVLDRELLRKIQKALDILKKQLADLGKELEDL